MACRCTETSLGRFVSRVWAWLAIAAVWVGLATAPGEVRGEGAVGGGVEGGGAGMAVGFDESVRVWEGPGGLTIVTKRLGADHPDAGRVGMCLGIAAGTLDERVRFARGNGVRGWSWRGGGRGELGAARLSAKLATAGSVWVSPVELLRVWGEAGLRPSEHLSHDVGYALTRVALEAPASGEAGLGGVIERGAWYLGSLVGVGSAARPGAADVGAGPFVDGGALGLARKSLLDGARDAASVEPVLVERAMPAIAGEGEAGRRLAAAFPDGTRSLEEGAGVNAVRGFAMRHYRAENAVLVVVSSLEHEACAEVLGRVLGGLRGVADPWAGWGAGRGVPEVRSAFPGDRGVTRVVRVGEKLAVPVVLSGRLSRGSAAAGTAAELRVLAAERVALELMRTRVEGLMDGANSGVVGSGATRVQLGGAGAMSIASAAGGDGWEEAAQRLVGAMSAGTRAGSDEIRRASRAVLERARAGVSVSDGLGVGALAGDAAQRWRAGQAVSSGAARFEAFRDALATVTEADVRGAAQRAAAPERFAFVLLLPGDEPESDIAQRFDEAIASAITAPPNAAIGVELDAFPGGAQVPVVGEPLAIIDDGAASASEFRWFTSVDGEERRDPATIDFSGRGIEAFLAVYTNGVSLSAAPMRGEDAGAVTGGERVVIACVFGVGPLTEGSWGSAAGLQEFAAAPSVSGLGSAETRAMLRSQGWSVSAVRHPELLVLTLAGPPSGLETGLGFVAGVMTSPEVAEPKESLWIPAIRAAIGRPGVAREVAFIEATRVEGDPRTHGPTETFGSGEDAAAVLRDAFTASPVRIGVAGAADVRSVLSAASRTIGLVPGRTGVLSRGVLDGHGLRGERPSPIVMDVTRELDEARAGVLIGRLTRDDGRALTRATNAVIGALVERRTEESLSSGVQIADGVGMQHWTASGPLTMPRLMLGFNTDPPLADLGAQLADVEFRRVGAERAGERELEEARRAVRRGYERRLADERSVALGLALGGVYPTEHPSMWARVLERLPEVGAERVLDAGRALEEAGREIRLIVRPASGDVGAGDE